MIKVNLAKFKPATNAAAIDGAAPSPEGEDIAAVRKTAVTRLALLVLGPILLMVIQEQIIPDLEAKLRQRQNELNEVSDKNRKAAEAVTQTKKFKKEQEVLQAQINSIENLKRDRLREVKVLDFLQKDIPEKMWMTRLDFSESRMVIQGLTATDADLTTFMENLSKSVYMKEVSLVKSSDFNSPDFGSLRRFEISCLMEKLP